MSNTLFNKMGKVVYIPGEAPTDETGTADYRQGDRIYRASCSVRRRLGDKTDIAGGGCLSLGQPVDLIIMHQIGNIMIATGSMEKMVAPLAVGIPVAADGDDYQLRIGNLGADSWRNRSAMQGVEHVASGVVR